MATTDLTKKEKVFCEDCKFRIPNQYNPSTCALHPLPPTQYVARDLQWKACYSINKEGDCPEFEKAEKPKKKGNMLFLIPFIILLVILLLYVWCSCSVVTSATEEEPNYCPASVKVFTFKNHQYILFGYVGGNSSGVVLHDPDCPCHNSK